MASTRPFLNLKSMHIIEYINYEIVPTQEAFLIKPIREIYNNDSSPTKESFMQQMSILYFLVDPRSSYAYILDEKERLKEILVQEGLPKNYKLSKELKEAIEVYKKHIVTSSSLLLEDTRIAIEKVRTFLREVDLTETDVKGKPIYTINSITSALKQIPDLAKQVVETEKLILKEMEEKGRVRGGEHKKIMEEGILC